MELAADSDIDFIIWGPFDNLTEAISKCGTLGDSISSPIVDCSYSGTSHETPEILSAASGEVYVLLITNYSSVVQDIVVNKISGEATTVCIDNSPEPCASHAGTFRGVQYGELLLLDEEIVLYHGNSFLALSNGDYTLPNDTIPLPLGDGIYSSQLMWLVYTDLPTDSDPNMDPGYTGFIVPSQDLYGVNDTTSSVIQTLGYGTYYFVPVAGDDGVGGNGNVANGINDNGAVHWDRNENGCYHFSFYIKVTYLDILEVDKNYDSRVYSFTNPVENSLYVRFEEFNMGRYTIVVHNLLGELIYSEVVTDESLIEIEMQKVSPGSYILSVLNEDLLEIYHSKFIVEKE